jgi:hypothetical protein
MRIKENSVQLHNDIILKTHFSVADVWCMYQGAKATQLVLDPVQPQQLTVIMEWEAKEQH